MKFTWIRSEDRRASVCSELVCSLVACTGLANRNRIVRLESRVLGLGVRAQSIEDQIGFDLNRCRSVVDVEGEHRVVLGGGEG